MIDVATAASIVDQTAVPLAAQATPIDRIEGRVLAQTVVAERDQPPFDRVTMDGIAVRYEQGRRQWLCHRQQFAGDPATSLDDTGEAIEIMTGAVLPDGADTVIPNERYRLTQTELGWSIELEAGYEPTQGQFIHRRGSDHSQGHPLLRPGQLMRPAEVAIAASTGLTTLSTTMRPSVAVVATGNELVSPGEPILDHQVRLSNAPALAAAAEAITGEQAQWHHLPDDRDVLTDQLRGLLVAHQVVILSGGVSRGRADYVPEVLESLGAVCHFHRVAQKPGKPLWFGSTQNGTLVFGLPGNPVSTLACFCRYVRPALLRMAGHSPTVITVRLAEDWTFNPKLTALVPVTLAHNGQGELLASPLSTNTSGDFSALAGADGFVELTATDTHFEAGRCVSFFAWR